MSQVITFADTAVDSLSVSQANQNNFHYGKIEFENGKPQKMMMLLRMDSMK